MTSGPADPPVSNKTSDKCEFDGDVEEKKTCPDVSIRDVDLYNEQK